MIYYKIENTTQLQKFLTTVTYPHEISVYCEYTFPLYIKSSGRGWFGASNCKNLPVPAYVVATANLKFCKKSIIW